VHRALDGITAVKIELQGLHRQLHRDANCDLRLLAERLHRIDRQLDGVVVQLVQIRADATRCSPRQRISC
jgi:hypothetical protein